MHFLGIKFSYNFHYYYYFIFWLNPIINLDIMNIISWIESDVKLGKLSYAVISHADLTSLVELRVFSRHGFPVYITVPMMNIMCLCFLFSFFVQVLSHSCPAIGFLPDFVHLFSVILWLLCLCIPLYSEFELTFDCLSLLILFFLHVCSCI